MAKEIQELARGFDISVEWPAIPVSGGDRALDASVGRLKIEVGGVAATAYRSDKGDTGATVEIPLYDLVEWLASNWWSILFEPKKSEDSEIDTDFRFRHWLGSARKGLALPSVWFLPAGDDIEIDCEEAYLRFSRLTFTERAATIIPRRDFRTTLKDFVNRTFERMAVNNVRDTAAHRFWRLVEETEPEEEIYCQLMGSLGLSPYQENPATTVLLDEAMNARIPHDILIDICEAAQPHNLAVTLAKGSGFFEALANSKPSNLEVLSEIQLPSDNSSLAWRWGLECSKRVQAKLAISPFDANGSERFFDALRLDYAGLGGITDTEEVSAALSRQELEMHVALGDSPEPQRRFNAARAAFLGWTAKERTQRLVTGAKTRQQQASRAFAAQLLAPIEYIKARSANQILSKVRVSEIAGDLNVSPAVVGYQAVNNRINIV